MDAITSYYGFSHKTRQVSPVVSFGNLKEVNKNTLLSMIESVKNIDNIDDYKIYVSKAYIKNDTVLKSFDFIVDGKKLKNSIV